MSIERRGNSWRITVDVAGRRYRETHHGTKTAAKKREVELRHEIAKGTTVQPTKETLGEFLRRWVEHRKSLGKVRDRTAVVYLGYIEREVDDRIGSMLLTEVRPMDVQDVLDEMTKSRLSARTTVQVFRILHAAFRTAVKWRLISVNPCDGASAPETKPPKLKTPTPADIKKLIGSVDPEFRPMIELAAATGLRRGEVAALKWTDVDLDAERGRLRVKGTLQRADGELVVLPPKSSRSRREVPLSATTVGILKAVRASQRERRLRLGPAYRDLGYVFDTGAGSPVDPDTVTRRFTAARDAVGLEGVRLHDLRHSFASELVEAGTSIRIVSDLLGHSSTSFTMDTYAHGADTASVAAIDAIEQLHEEAR